MSEFMKNLPIQCCEEDAIGIFNRQVNFMFNDAIIMIEEDQLSRALDITKEGYHRLELVRMQHSQLLRNCRICIVDKLSSPFSSKNITEHEFLITQFDHPICYLNRSAGTDVLLYGAIIYPVKTSVSQPETEYAKQMHLFDEWVAFAFGIRNEVFDSDRVGIQAKFWSSPIAVQNCPYVDYDNMDNVIYSNNGMSTILRDFRIWSSMAVVDMAADLKVISPEMEAGDHSHLQFTDPVTKLIHVGDTDHTLKYYEFNPAKITHQLIQLGIAPLQVEVPAWNDPSVKVVLGELG